MLTLRFERAHAHPPLGEQCVNSSRADLVSVIRTDFRCSDQAKDCMSCGDGYVKTRKQVDVSATEVHV